MSRLNQLLQNIHKKRPAKPYLCRLRRGTVDCHPCDPVNTSGEAPFEGAYIVCAACPFDNPRILQKFLEDTCPDSLP